MCYIINMQKSIMTLILVFFVFLSCNNGSTDRDIYYYEELPRDAEVENTYVFLIGLDGWGGYSVSNKSFNMPTVTGLMNDGCYTIKAKNVKPTISLPNWSSMFMGTSPKKTGYKTNEPSKADSKIVDMYGIFPSIFTLLTKQRPQCKAAFFYEWSVNGALCPDGVIDKKQHISNLSKDVSVVSDYIKSERPNFCAIAIDEPDGVGHSAGHNTRAYYEELSKLDVLIAQIIQAIKDAGIWDNSIIMLSADHGGVNKGHGGNTLSEREIPFIICGNNVKEGVKISQNVMIYDIAPTIAYILKLETPSFWEGSLIPCLSH